MNLDKKHHRSFSAVSVKHLGFSLSYLLIACLLFLALTSSACSTVRLQINEFTKEKSKLPRDMKSAEEDYDILKDTSCLVTVNGDSGVFLIGKEQFSKEQISEKIKRLMEDKTPDKRIVYIESAESVKYETLVTLLNLIRKTDIDKVGLVVIRQPTENPAAKPARFEVKLPVEPNDMDSKIPVKPNPLTLIVEIDKTGNLFLNREQMGNAGDTNNLMSKLSQVFKERENNGIFREGTNEVEKTVFIKGSRSIKYGDVVKVIDAVKMAGAQPIGLQIDDLSE